MVAAEGDAFLPADSCVEIALLDSRKRKAFYKIEWKTEGKRFFNHFVTWKAPFDKVAYLKYAEKAGIIKRVQEQDLNKAGALNGKRIVFCF